MWESGRWWKHALQSALQETTDVDSKISLVRMAILERLVAEPAVDPKEADELYEALDELRALDWQRFSDPTTQISLLA